MNKTKFRTIPEKLKLPSCRTQYFDLFGKVRLFLQNCSNIFLATMVLYLRCSCNKLSKQRNISLNITILNITNITRNYNFGKKTYQNTVTITLKNWLTNKTNRKHLKKHTKRHQRLYFRTNSWEIMITLLLRVKISYFVITL